MNVINSTSIQSKRGFTLIELLTVIAIIGILAAILIPVVGAVRENARAATCSSNIRQLGQAMLMYVNDNGGKAPPGRDDLRHEASGGGAGSTSLASTYFYVLWPYVHDSLDTLVVPFNTVTLNSATANVFHCPTRHQSYPTASAAPADMFVSGSGENFASARYAYAINTMAAPARGVRVAIPVDTMSAPSRTVAIVEDYYWYTTEPYYFDRFGVIPHNQAANFLFFDGHVERLGPGQFPGKSEARDSVFWSGDNAS